MEQHPGLGSYFYLSLGRTEEHTLEDHQKLTALFEQNKAADIHWHYALLDRFASPIQHQTTPLESLTDGLAWHFNDYPDLSFYSVADISHFGGIAAVKNYYRQRGQRYQVSEEVGEQAKFSMFRWAAQENNWAFFQKLENELGTFKVYAWYGLFGSFFAENNQLERAEQVFKRALDAGLTDHRYWAGLAGIYGKQGKYAEAARQYQKAMAQLQPAEPAYAQYQAAIERLQALN
ncbi:tetratricopeptide repeat protein [Shewanella sedimentimangrovi]|uniref:Tetratricopeptide repeat protein n=1 Tax=Shewanella sedimentimangrovi TaxID=2814293 RepID=A0ABX7R5Q7_9GAMM|nr:hypothetical protein [Shewanella sedimentimangrovi]QSX38415.1 hypothetical protein JYB85_06225 [Shewanella sedimentimangrovi]